MKKKYVKVVFRNGESECYQIKDFKQRGTLVDLYFDNHSMTLGNVKSFESFTLERVKR